MITVKQWMELVDYRITEGSDYGWNCYGAHSYQLDSWNGDYKGHSFCIIFDAKTQEVYEVQAHDYANERAYRVVNPAYLKAMQQEAVTHGSQANEAWECVNYVDLETDEDWLEKATAIAKGESYDTRVSVPLTLNDSELFDLMKMAHERDMTLNQLVEEVLTNAIKDLS